MKKIIIASVCTTLTIILIFVFETKPKITQEESFGMLPLDKSLSGEVMENCTEPELPEYIEVISQVYSSAEHANNVWKLYDIDLSGELQEYTVEVCEQYGVDPIMVFAIMGCESEYQADAISKTNDYGLMQINICNHKSLGKTLDIQDFLDAKSSILAGVYILSTIQATYEDRAKILMCYNLGVNGAKRYWNKGIYSNTYTTKIIERMESIKIIAVE